jgi:hypothetical protein
VDAANATGLLEAFNVVAQVVHRAAPGHQAREGVARLPGHEPAESAVAIGTASEDLQLVDAVCLNHGLTTAQEILR